MARCLTANFEGKFANLRGEICQFSPRDLPSNHWGEIKNHEKFLQNSRPDFTLFASQRRGFPVAIALQWPLAGAKYAYKVNIL